MMDEPEWYDGGEKRILKEVKTIGKSIGVEGEITEDSYFIRNSIKEILDRLFEIRTMMNLKQNPINKDLKIFTKRGRGRPRKI